MRRHTLVALTAAVALSLAACGSDTASGDAGSSDTAPDTSVAGDTSTTITDVSLAPVEIEVPADKPDGVEPAAEIPTELVIEDIKPGAGYAAVAGDTVIVDYMGARSEDGAEFDNSYDRGQPFDVLLGSGGVIAGWDEGLVGVQAGMRRRLDIPAEMAYGDNPPAGTEVVRPGDALTFIIDVRAVIPAVDPSEAPTDLQVDPSVGATELTTIDHTVGDGPALELGQTAIIHVILARGDNEVVLFNSWDTGDPLQVIMEDGTSLPGLFQGLQGMKVGGVRSMTMPPDLAFGEAGDPGLGLPAATDLIIVAQLLGAF